MQEIGLTLEGEHGRIDVRALTSALDQLTRLVRSVADDPKTPLPVVKLSLGSAMAGILVPDEADMRIRRGIPELRKSRTLPSYWDVNTLEAIRSLAGLANAGDVEGVTLTVDEEAILVDVELGELARDVVEKAPESLGTISGRLYSYSNPEGRGQATVGVEQLDTRRKTKVKISQDLVEVAQAMLEKEVQIWGSLSRDPETGRVLKMVALGLEELPDRAPSLPISTIRGLWANDGLESVEVVRGLRGE